MGVRGCDKF